MNAALMPMISASVVVSSGVIGVAPTRIANEIAAVDQRADHGHDARQRKQPAAFE